MYTVLFWALMGVKWKVRSNKVMYSDTVKVVSPQRNETVPSLGNAFTPLP
jgi:hypothetical protein